MIRKLIALSTLAVVSCGTPTAEHAAAAKHLDTLAAFIDHAAASDKPAEVAASLRVIAGWVRAGFVGDRQQLSDAVTLIRRVLAEATALGANPPAELLQALALADAWLQAGK